MIATETAPVAVASRVGLGIFKNYSLIRSRGLVALPMQSKSKVEMRLGVSIFASPQF